ncbi:MAG: hypothetical protein IPM29_20955 [Planctomycetes bacterium]|nr:hypothetical protein [Planctomycetota bacterium]
MHLPLHRRFPLGRGAHTTRDDGLCAMELVAWLAGEPHTDEPRCACPVLTAYVRALNDLLPDAMRDRLLRPFAPRLVGTRGDLAVTEIRAWLLADRAARLFAPRSLVAAGRRDHADALRSMPPLDEPGHALEAARILDNAGASLARAARWSLGFAAAGWPATAWVPGVARAARDAGALLLAVQTLDDAIVGQSALPA